jgi:hypothetical protein
MLHVLAVDRHPVTRAVQKNGREGAVADRRPAVVHQRCGLISDARCLWKTFPCAE